MITKKENGKYQLDVRLNGHTGRRVRKVFSTKSEANRFEAMIRKNAINGEEWNPKEGDRRRLSELVHLWHDLHGHTLKDIKYRYTRTLALCERLGDPIAANFSGSDFAKYRTSRMKEGISAQTINHELSYLRAVFNELSRLEEWEGDNPLSKVRKIKIDETELACLLYTSPSPRDRTRSRMPSSA